VYDARIIEKMLKTTILFVCSGNTCRSPMAEALTRQIVSDRLKVSPNDLVDKGYVIGSAGVIAASGGRATAPAVAAIDQLGGDLSKHRSRPLSPELIHQADAIFVMGETQRRRARSSPRSDRRHRRPHRGRCRALFVIGAPIEYPY
jgi:protein-tyrosine-phosphatase